MKNLSNCFKFIKIVFLSAGMCFTVQAQVKIGDSPTTIDPSAVLHLQSSNKGLLPPVMTTTQRNAIASPATGLVVYNTTNTCLESNLGTAAAPSWSCVGGGPAKGTIAGAYNLIGTTPTIVTFNQPGISVPGLSQSFTTTAQTLIQVIGIGYAHGNGNFAGNFTGYFELWVDNIKVTSGFISAVDGRVPVPTTFTYMALLNAGSHTVEMKYKTTMSVGSNTGDMRINADVTAGGYNGTSGVDADAMKSRLNILLINQ